VRGFGAAWRDATGWMLRYACDVCVGRGPGRLDAEVCLTRISFIDIGAALRVWLGC